MRRVLSPRTTLFRRRAGLQRVQFLAGLEAHRLTGGDADLGAGAGVAADAGFACADAEDAKARNSMRSPAVRACLRPSKTVSTAASAFVRGRPVRSIT